VLEVEGLSVGYGYLQVIWDLSFNVNQSEVVAILGLNGAGKTTTLKAIAGLLSPIGGKIRLNGDDITGLQANEVVRRGLAFIPEERNLFEGMSVYENLILGAYIIKDSKKVSRTLDYVYSLFPRLADRKRQLVGTMSGGERQMVAIARGLMSSPQLVMLDEPSMGLSPQNVRVVFDAIATLREQQVTVVIVEQNVADTLEASDRAYVMEQGRIVMEGQSHELLHDDYVMRRYLGIDE
jgi:branched-chain amino acid transport system ATP-binding protein